eukprot:m.427941 g.427941  ORF g.427941 m.427941 type:complete len:324 (-) comp56702_c0_seq28:1834-2805(-)
MEWFAGDVAAGIQHAQTAGAPVIFYCKQEGPCDMDSLFSRREAWQPLLQASALPAVAFRLVQGTTQFAQFTEMCPITVLPCVLFISSTNGQVLERLTGEVSLAFLRERVAFHCNIESIPPIVVEDKPLTPLELDRQKVLAIQSLLRERRAENEVRERERVAAEAAEAKSAPAKSVPPTDASPKPKPVPVPSPAPSNVTTFRLKRSTSASSSASTPVPTPVPTPLPKATPSTAPVSAVLTPEPPTEGSVTTESAATTEPAVAEPPPTAKISFRFPSGGTVKVYSRSLASPAPHLIRNFIPPVLHRGNSLGMHRFPRLFCLWSRT